MKARMIVAMLLVMLFIVVMFPFSLSSLSRLTSAESVAGADKLAQSNLALGDAPLDPQHSYHRSMPEPPYSYTDMAGFQVPLSVTQLRDVTLYSAAKGHIQADRATLPTSLASCTVSTPADSGLGSLRHCLLNAREATTIEFDPTSFPPTAPVTIALQSPLPPIVADQLTIDASNAGVILTRSRTTTSIGVGLIIDGAQGVRVRGLQILDFLDGILLINGAQGAVIGGDRAVGTGPFGQGNLLSDNAGAGIRMTGAGTSHNQVLGNFIGTNVAGTSALGNYQDGIVIDSGASANVIGGTTETIGNLISGNGRVGILILGATGNKMLGNHIGTNVTGTGTLGNVYGIVLSNGAGGNMIGGEEEGARNLISGNTERGIVLQDLGTNDNQILGNYIGTDVTGTEALGIQMIGVFAGFGARDNVIGGNSSVARNVISGNVNLGVQLQDPNTNGNQILGNYIGTNATGSEALGNDVGVAVTNASENVIGGNSPGARNVISGNRRGIELAKSNTINNSIRGNYIGLNADGTAAIGNSAFGIVIGQGASRNVIGGRSSNARNVISGNGGHSVFQGAGILVQDASTEHNLIIGNYIGTDAAGQRAMGNFRDGVVIGFAHDNLIGGNTEAERNLISGNFRYGMFILDLASGNQVLGNLIGTDSSGMSALGNGEHGIFIFGGSNNNIIGETMAGAHNVISGNAIDGIRLANANTTGNRIQGNYIGIGIDSTRPISNAGYGIYLGAGANANMIGISNTIAHNAMAGVAIDGETTRKNTITQNIIRQNGDLPIDWIGNPSPISPPALIAYAASTRIITGRTCRTCRVEIFANASQEPAGMIYLGATTADAAGDFRLTLANPPPLPYLAATATDPDGTTYEFSSSLFVGHRTYLPVVRR